MLMREALEDGKVLLELADADGKAVLSITVHQPGAERLLHAHLFEWLDERASARAAPSAHPQPRSGFARVLSLDQHR
jgi:hypothetical protein